jgi:hypothetical protein
MTVFPTTREHEARSSSVCVLPVGFPPGTGPQCGLRTTEATAWTSLAAGSPRLLSGCGPVDTS